MTQDLTTVETDPLVKATSRQMRRDKTHVFKVSTTQTHHVQLCSLLHQDASEPNANVQVLNP